EQRRPFGLPANRPFGDGRLAAGDFYAVDLGGELAVLGRDFGRVPFAGLDGLLLSDLVELVLAARKSADVEDMAVVALHALHFDALGPAAAVFLDVNQQAAVAVLQIFPVVTEDVVLVALLGVEVALGLAADVDDLFLDREGVGRAFAEDVELEAVHVLAVEESDEALVVAGAGGGRESDEGDQRGGCEQTHGAIHGGKLLER